MDMQESVNLFLDDLRESGAVNMFGAAPVLQEVFGITRHEAKDLLLNWMQTFAERHPS